MAEWLYEAGIGEARAALVQDGALLEMAVEPDDGVPRVGAIIEARLTRKADVTGRALVTFADGATALGAPMPPGVPEGASLLVEVIRTAIPEAGRVKPAKVRPALPDAIAAPGPTLLQRIGATDSPIVRMRPYQPDRLEAHGWSEALEEAVSGEIPFAGGLLLMALTPAMTIFDVDGILPRDDLARAGALAAARAIRRFDIGGSIGIDLPTVETKAARQAAAAALDAALPPPFERTAVNGFGFLQVVRRRVRPSIPELLRSDPVGSAARALLRKAERATGAGTRTLVAHPKLIARIEQDARWIDELGARTGVSIALRGDSSIAISAAYVETQHP